MYFIGVEAFLAIVECGSVTKAADILHITQSSVSYRLRVLEEELGFRLIERNQGIQGVNLTEKGYLYLAVAEKLRHLMDEAEGIREMKTIQSLTIGTADSISRYLLPEFYKQLYKKYKPFVLTQHTLETYESIQSKEIDIGFVKREYSMPNVLVTKIHEEDMILVRYGKQKDYMLPISPEALDSSQEIFMDWGYSYQIWHDNWWTPNRYTIRVDAAALIFEMLEDASQWAIVPKSVYETYKDRGNFSRQPLLSSPPKRMSYMIRHKNADSSLGALFEFTQSFFKAESY